MVTCYSIKADHTTCSPMIGRLVDIINVASNENVILIYQNVNVSSSDNEPECSIGFK